MTQFDPQDPAAVARVLVAKGFKLPNEHVALVRAAAETKTKGGLFIPSQAQRTARKGVIVMKSALVDRDINVGDGALLQLYEATLVKAVIGGVEIPLEILNQRDILMTFPGNSDANAAFAPEKMDPLELGGARFAAMLAAGTAAGLWLVDKSFSLVNSHSNLGVLVGVVSLAVMAVAWTKLATMFLNTLKREKKNASSIDPAGPGAGGTHG